jgi:hypothetical protein
MLFAQSLLCNGKLARLGVIQTAIVREFVKVDLHIIIAQKPYFPAKR